MRRRHFDALQPLCVVCHAARVTVAGDGDVIQGIATCTNPECLREYPIIDGIPIFVANIRAWLSANPLQVLLRDDLSPELESLIGDVLGPGSAFDTLRHHVGIYAGAEPLALEPPTEGPAIDIGCAVGVNTFAIARQLTVGVDLNFAMLRAASRPHYDRGRVGVV